MKKVIVKYRVDDFERLENKMIEMDVDFSPIYWLHDRVYVPRGYKRGMNLPRMIMRTEMRSVDRPAKYSVVLKRHIEDSGVDIEEETEVRSYAAMVGMIAQLGFKEAGEVSRRRQEARVSDGVMMFVDYLDSEDGQFVKIEAILNPGDSVEETRTRLRAAFGFLDEKKMVEQAYFDSE